MALEADERGLSYHKGPLAVMEEIRARPLHEPEAVERMMETVLAARKANWRDED
jgi:hypothetical protein